MPLLTAAEVEFTPPVLNVHRVAPVNSSRATKFFPVPKKSITCNCRSRPDKYVATWDYGPHCLSSSLVQRDNCAVIFAKEDVPIVYGRRGYDGCGRNCCRKPQDRPG